MKRISTALMAALMAATSMYAGAPTKVNHPDWSRNAVIYEVNVRQSTPEGTFKAFKEQLPRLKDLGVDILWFMPIYPISEANRKGTLGSYYAVRDVKGVNPEFGNMDDFRAVVNQAHELGMKVILDWVPNHTGCDNPWVAQYPKRYKLNDEGKMYGPYDWTDVYQLDYSNPDTRAAMTDALVFWLREGGVDGFRCDVASMVPTDYWNEVRPQLEAVQPQLFMLAEASVPELEEQGFDMAYNWPMKDMFNAVASGAGQYTYVKPGKTEVHAPKAAAAADIYALNNRQLAEYPDDAYMMNMITNHDLNSWEGTEFQRLGTLTDAFAVLSYTLPGMPLIYTGQEVGLNRAFEFFEKDKAPDFTPNRYTSFYKTLNALKHNRAELAAGNRGGKVEPLAVSNPDILVFSRTVNGKTTLTGVNLGNEPTALTFTAGAPDVDGMEDIFTGEEAVLPAAMAPGEYFVFTN